MMHVPVYRSSAGIKTYEIKALACYMSSHSSLSGRGCADAIATGKIKRHKLRSQNFRLDVLTNAEIMLTFFS